MKVRMLIILSCVLCAACTAPQISNSKLESITLIDAAGQNHLFQVEVARTDAEREKGLMERTEVSHGMIFLFDSEQPLSFWMKNTVVPLDILFFNSKGVIVSWTTMPPCTADPCPTYASSSPAEFALEMPAGFLAAQKINSQWKLER